MQTLQIANATTVYRLVQNVLIFLTNAQIAKEISNSKETLVKLIVMKSLNLMLKTYASLVPKNGIMEIVSLHVQKELGTTMELAEIAQQYVRLATEQQQTIVTAVLEIMDYTKAYVKVNKN